MFLKDYLFSFVFVLLLAGNVFAQDSAKNDSLRHTTAPPITVTSESYNDEIAIHPADIHTVSSEQLEIQTGAARLSDALQVLHPSLDIRNYGSLGGISLASFRGLPAEYIGVYWEGICITDPQHSFTDFGLIDLKSVQSVGIISAANAQLLGGDVGGAGILLGTNTSARGSGLDIGSSGLSYNDLSTVGEKQLDLGGAYKVTDNLSFAGGLNTAYSDGAFPFQQEVDNKFVTTLRENNDAHLLNANLAGDLMVDSTATIKGLSYFSRAERGAPGEVTIDDRGASDFAARQYDENFLLALSLSHEALSYLHYTVSAGYQSQYETYSDPLKAIADRYLNRIYTLTAKSKLLIGNWSDLYFGIDYTKDYLFSNENSLSPGDTIISRNHYAAYGADNIRLLNNFDATVSLRTEMLSDINKVQFLPGASLHYLEPNSYLSLQASFGRIYHAPTFNELYWRVGGNPDLLPESGSTTEISVGLPISFNKDLSLELQSTVFQTVLQNQIVWLERSDGIYSPSNVESSRSQGFEFSGELQYSFLKKYRIKLHEGLSLQQTKNLTLEDSLFGKELPYSMPMRSAFLLSVRHSDIGELTFFILYRGHRYTDYQNNESTKLPPVTTFDLTFSADPIFITAFVNATIRLTLIDLTNIQYDEIPAYPQPGRSIRASVEFHFL